MSNTIKLYIAKHQKQLIIVSVLMLAYAVARLFELHWSHGLPLLAIGALDDFGERFARDALKRVYQSANFPAITNRNFEGEVKEAGDRLNILSFPGEFQLEDYVAGTDMSTFPIFDLEDVLVVEKRRSRNVGPLSAKAIVKNWVNCWKPLGVISSQAYATA